MTAEKLQVRFVKQHIPSADLGKLLVAIELVLSKILWDLGGLVKVKADHRRDLAWVAQKAVGEVISGLALREERRERCLPTKTTKLPKSSTHSALTKQSRQSRPRQDIG